MDSAADSHVASGAIAAAAAGFLLPALALALRTAHVPALAEIPVLPFVSIAAMGAACLLLQVDARRALFASTIVSIAAVPSLACAAWLDGGSEADVFVDSANIITAVILARGCAMLSPGAGAGLLFTAAAALPPFLLESLRILRPRGGAPEWAENGAAFSPFVSAARGDLRSLTFAASASVVIFIFGAFASRRARDGNR